MYLRQGRGRQRSVGTRQHTEQILKPGIVAHDHGSLARFGQITQHRQPHIGPGVVQSGHFQDSSLIATGPSNHLCRMAGTFGGRTDNQIRSEVFIEHELAHPRRIALATRVQRPVMVRRLGLLTA